jgi:uncharacterized membrane protein (DUF106 family)
MLTLLNDLIVSGLDVVLGWMLHLGQLFALVVVGVGTSAVLTFIRPWTTDQDLLRRCKTDKKRLKELIREAKGRKDTEAIKRHRQTIAGLGMKQMFAEARPLAVALIPVACLAVWAFARLAYVPPESGQPITVKAYFRASAIGSHAHIAPVEGLDADNTAGWIRPVVEDPEVGPGGKVNGIAVWTLRAERRDEPYLLRVRSGGATAQKPMLVDGIRTAPVLDLYDNGPIEAVQLDLPLYKPLGIVPGIPWIAFDPWIVGYLIITIPFVFLLRRIAGIF